MHISNFTYDKHAANCRVHGKDSMNKAKRPLLAPLQLPKVHDPLPMGSLGAEGGPFLHDRVGSYDGGSNLVDTSLEDVTNH